MLLAVYVRDHLNQEAGNDGLLIFLNGIPTVCFAITMLLAKKYKIFAELLGPSLYVVHAMCVALAFYYGALHDTTKAMRNLILGQSLIIYLVYIGLLNVRHLQHFIIRILMGYPCKILISLARIDQNESSMWQAAYLFFSVLIFTEVIFFVQFKAQAKLYLSLKVTDS